MAHGFERPERRLALADVVEHQNFGLEHRLEHAHLRGLILGVVAILNFFEQLAVIVKKPAMSAQDDLLQRGDGEMRFPNAARAHQQQAVLVAERKFGGEFLDHQLRLRKAAIP